MSYNTQRHRSQRLAHLEEQLEETKFQLQKERELKVGFFNQAHRATEELKRIKRCIDPETLKVVAVACQAHFSVEDLDKEELQQKYEDLNVAQFHVREAMLEELNDERKRNETLKEEVEELKAAYEELRSRYQTDVGLVSQEGKKQTTDELKINEELSLEKLRAEKDEIINEMAQKINLLEESEKRLQDELEESKRETNELINNLKQQEETYKEKIKQQEVALSQERKENCIHELNYSVLREHFEKFDTEMTREKETLMDKSEEYMELLDNMRTEYAILQEKSKKDIDFLTYTAKILQEELNESKTLHKELQCKYNTDIAALKDELERCQDEVRREKEASIQTASEKQQLIDSLREENAILQENTRREIQVLKETERNAQAELETIRVLFKEIQCCYINDVNILKQEAELHQREMARIKQELETAKHPGLSLHPEKAQDEDLQSNHTAVSQQEEEKNRVDPVMDFSLHVSSEEDQPMEALPGCSTDLECTEDDIKEENILQDFQIPDINGIQEAKKKKPKVSIWKKIRNIFKKSKKTTHE